MAQIERPPRRKKETDEEYQRRSYRWGCWKLAEPRPDLWFASDTEVAEYRKWARS